MESHKKDKFEKLTLHPHLTTNLLGKLFFCWTIPTFRKGFKKDLSEEDLYQPLKKHDSHRLANRLEKAWNKRLAKNLKPSLWLSIWKVFKWDISKNIIIFFTTEVILRISRPVALGKLMGYYFPGQTETNKNDIILYASLIILITFVDVIISHAYVLHVQEISLKVRVACASLLYRKSLRLSRGELHQATIGHMVNLLSNDLQQIVDFWSTINCIWSSPLQTTVILVLLYYIAGITSLAGLLFLILLIPIQLFMSKKSAVYRLKIALKTDDRIRYMSEIISGIQVIKIYNWEKPFVKLIDAIRKKEVALIRVFTYMQVMSDSFSFFVDRTAIFICILTYILTGNSLNAQYVFVVCAFYDLLMESISLYLPDAVTDILQARVAVGRFENFLLLGEKENKIQPMEPTGISLDQITAKWSQDSNQNTLSRICFEAKPKELVAIIGPIGSGKSSLLQLFLGEIPIINGSAKIGGRISYASQEPWLFGGSIKQNILFGEEMVLEKYKEVVKVCGLEEDIALFPYGDNTIVGERGVLLSGGQKARIGLARAIYKDADIYLLDDPLSAVDASVGKLIFNNCIAGYLKDKCTVLITHQVQFLASVDRIYLLANGRVATQGSYKELQASGESFSALFHTNTEKQELNKETATLETETSKDFSEEEEEKETRQTGTVSRKVYTTYIKTAGTVFTSLLIVALFTVTELLATGADYYLSFWLNIEQDRISNGTTTPGTYLEFSSFNRETFIYIYSAIIGSLIMISIFRSIAFVKSCMRASVQLHNNMFTCIVNATMRFFYTNSSGRILNRFAKDIGTMDNNLPATFLDTFQVTLAVFGTTLAICIVSPWTIIPTAAIFCIMFVIRKIVMESIRSLKRMEATNRSPIFAHLTETVKGLTTIRAFDAQKILEQEFDSFQNNHSLISYLYLGCQRAFGTWMDLVCICYVLGVTGVALFNETYGGNVGFIITQAMSLTFMFQWGVRRWSELENQMTSVERIIEYSDIERENDKFSKTPPLFWPEQGKVEFKSVYMQYSCTNPYVLKKVSFSINPRQKIGIVGRTGAGKSSLISVLYRLVGFDGDVIIDGVNTKEVSLSELRSKISIIPQDPVLFSGTVRKNLDPFDQYQDQEIWNVLDEVRLKDFVAQSLLGLHSNISEGGSNFSTGQKQLVCLARALLKTNKILVLDEATANVDPQTDELLQKTIKKSFGNCTVLTIAHRLHTIMESDKVLVMNDGFVAEFDHPYTLLLQKGVFYDLVMETGKKMGENLVEIAHKSYHNNNL